jgi:hypothetical protein
MKLDIRNIGLAAQNHIWDFDHPAFSGIKSFLVNLFK